MSLNNLKEALNEYKKVLSDDEKKKLYAEKKPDVLAAIQLTTRINECSQNSNRQGLSPRLGAGLAKFLQSVQHFSGVVDTFVSSNPEIAALVWGGVKLALLILGNVTSYLEKLSDLFVRLQNDFPRFAEYEKLYQKSRGVQTALCNYYAMVIRLCRYSTKASRTSVYARLFVATVYPYESEFGKYEKQLKTLSKEFSKEINLELHQRQDASYEVQKLIKQDQEEYGKILVSVKDRMSHHGESFDSWVIEATRRTLEEGRSRVLECFSSYNYQKHYDRILRDRVPGTSDWICTTPAFRTWIAGSHKILWCNGRLGSGKSFISARVVAQITAEFPQDLVSYFFCRYDDLETLKGRTIVGSIAKQMASSLPANEFRSIYNDYRDPAMIIDFLKSKLSKERRFFIVLDGLDECTEVQSKEIADLFHDLLDSNLQIRFYCSSRPMKITSLAAKFQPQQRIDLEDLENKVHLAQDINHFIKMTMQGRRQESSPQLEFSDQETTAAILDWLGESSEGMFLWIKVQLDALCEEGFKDDILPALQDLPRTLSETYERILARFVTPKEIQLGKKIFCWATIAKRPLTIDELREALSIQPLQKSIDTKRLSINMDKALACCGNLVLTDQESQTVHFTHSSVKDYLTSEDVHESIKHYQIDLKQADAEAGAICTMYLHSLTNPDQVIRPSEGHRHFAEIPASVLGSNSLAKKTAKIFTARQSSQCSNSSVSIHRSFQDKLRDIEARRKRKGRFFQGYSEMFWLEHTKQKIDPRSSPVLWEMWCDLLEGADRSNNLCGVPWSFEDWKEHSDEILSWIEDQDHLSLAQFYLTSSLDSDSPGLVRPFIFAASKDHRDLVQLCLDQGNISPKLQNTVLISAVGNGHLDMVNIFLSANFDIDARLDLDHFDEGLQTAIHPGFSSIIQRLQFPEISDYTDATLIIGWTALQVAAGAGELEMVAYLLDRHAEVNANACQVYGRTALQASAGAGHRLVVARLLREKADVNALPCQWKGRTALQAAAENGHFDLVKRLLRRKADVNAAPCRYQGRTALQAAAGNGYLDTIKVLLQEGAKVNASPCHEYGRTALQAAAGNGYLDTIKVLLQEGAKVNASPCHEYGRTALQAAAENGFVQAVDILLAAGADIEGPVSAEGGVTALEAAVTGHHLEVKNILKMWLEETYIVRRRKIID